MANNVQPRRADRDLIWEVAHRDGIPQSAVIRAMVEAWLRENPGWQGRADELRRLLDRDPDSTHFGRVPADGGQP